MTCGCEPGLSLPREGADPLKGERPAGCQGRAPEPTRCIRSDRDVAAAHQRAPRGEFPPWLHSRLRFPLRPRHDSPARRLALHSSGTLLFNSLPHLHLSARHDTGCSSPDQGLHDKIVNRGHLHMRVCTHTGTGSVERHRRGFEHRETCYRATLHNTTDGKLCLQNARTPGATAQVCAGGLSLPRHSLSDSGTNRLG